MANIASERFGREQGWDLAADVWFSIRVLEGVGHERLSQTDFFCGNIVKADQLEGLISFIEEKLALTRIRYAEGAKSQQEPQDEIDRQAQKYMEDMRTDQLNTADRTLTILKDCQELLLLPSDNDK